MLTILRGRGREGAQKSRQEKTRAGAAEEEEDG